MAKPKTEIEDAPDVNAPPPEPTPGPYLSEQTRAEMELGRKTAEENGRAMAAAEARRAEEEAAKKTDESEKEAATRAAKLVVFPHAADGQVKT